MIDLEEKVEFILFFQMDRGKELNNFCPQSETTNFAFASVFLCALLFVWLLPQCFIEWVTYYEYQFAFFKFSIGGSSIHPQVYCIFFIKKDLKLQTV